MKVQGTTSSNLVKIWWIFAKLSCFKLLECRKTLFWENVPQSYTKCFQKTTSAFYNQNGLESSFFPFFSFRSVLACFSLCSGCWASCFSQYFFIEASTLVGHSFSISSLLLLPQFCITHFGPGILKLFVISFDGLLDPFLVLSNASSLCDLSWSYVKILHNSMTPLRSTVERNCSTPCCCVNTSKPFTSVLRASVPNHGIHRFISILH